MTCTNCGDKGLTVLNWTDADPDYAICLCPVGQQLRSTRNATKGNCSPLWQVWCALHQVDPARVLLLESVHSAEELAFLGFGPKQPSGGREQALLGMGREKRGKL